jgi:hypothetical protein
VLASYAEAVAVHPPRGCARIYARGLAAWRETRLASVANIGRLAELARRIADSVRPMGLPLFAGWRAEPAPAHPAAAAALALQVLRALRGDLHIHAVTAHSGSTRRTGQTPSVMPELMPAAQTKIDHLELQARTPLTTPRAPRNLGERDPSCQKSCQ